MFKDKIKRWTSFIEGRRRLQRTNIRNDPAAHHFTLELFAGYCFDLKHSRDISLISDSK
jgi:hypothetical protein